MMIDKDGIYDISDELHYLDDVAGPDINMYCEVAKSVVDNIAFLKTCGCSTDTAEQFYDDVMCGEYDHHLLERFVIDDWPYILELAKRSIREISEEVTKEE